MEYVHLSHIDNLAYYQFITFRTCDSSDDFLARNADNLKNYQQYQLAVDDHLDLSSQGTYLSGSVLIYLSTQFKNSDKIDYTLVAFAIMPNHVHLLLKPLISLPLLM